MGDAHFAKGNGGLITKAEMARNHKARKGSSLTVKTGQWVLDGGHRGLLKDLREVDWRSAAIGVAIRVESRMVVTSVTLTRHRTERIAETQRNHACNAGPPVSAQLVRRAMPNKSGHCRSQRAPSRPEGVTERLGVLQLSVDYCGPAWRNEWMMCSECGGNRSSKQSIQLQPPRRSGGSTRRYRRARRWTGCAANRKPRSHFLSPRGSCRVLCRRGGQCLEGLEAGNLPRPRTCGAR